MNVTDNEHQCNNVKNDTGSTDDIILVIAIISNTAILYHKINETKSEQRTLNATEKQQR